MSDTQSTIPNEPQTETATAHTESQPSLLHELRNFGAQVEAVARAFLASNQAHQIQQDLQKGVGELVERLQTVRQDERVVEATEKGKQVVERAISNPAVAEAQAKVIQGLASINDELRKLVNSLENDRHDKPSA